jgi:chromosome segregation ATPase
VGRDNVFRAIDLINFDPKLRPAMESIFGNSLICSDNAASKKVSF